LQPALSRRGCCATACYHSDPTLIVHSQALSSMRASPHLGCAIRAPRDRAAPHASVAHVHPTPPSIECRHSMSGGRQSTTSGSSVSNTSCQYPSCGSLAVFDIGTVITGRPSDGGPRRDVTTATTLTHSGHGAACCALRIHRYSVAVSARHFGDASEWRCVMLVGLRPDDVRVACSECVALLCDTHCTTGRRLMAAVLMWSWGCLSSS
jgi:hypothetical protein